MNNETIDPIEWWSSLSFGFRWVMLNNISPPNNDSVFTSKLPFLVPTAREIRNLWQVETLYLNSSNVGPEDIEQLKLFPNLVNLHLEYSHITDDDLDKLGDNVQYRLESLNMESFWADVYELSFLRDFVNLERLYLAGGKFSDISDLKYLTKLTSLDLSRCRVQDISPITNLKNLIALNLEHNPVEDISFILTLPKLRHISLAGTQVNPKKAYEIFDNMPYIETGRNGNYEYIFQS